MEGVGSGIFIAFVEGAKYSGNSIIEIGGEYIFFNSGQSDRRTKIGFLVTKKMNYEIVKFTPLVKQII